MQRHLNGVSTNDMPKFMLKNLMVNDHAVIIPLDIDDSSLSIPLMLQGVSSYFPVWAETLSEYESDIIPKFYFTAEAPMWDPDSLSYSSQEDSVLDFRGWIVSTVTMTRGQMVMHVNMVSSSLFASFCVVDATDDKNFGTYLEFVFTYFPD